MQKFPKWLPKVVADYCRTKIESKVLTEEQHECIIRLTTHETMRPAWETLERVVSKDEKLNPVELVAILDYVRLHPIVLFPKAYKPKLSYTNQRELMQQISIQSKGLLETLAQIDPARQDADQGIALLQYKINLIQKQARLVQDGGMVVYLHELQSALKAADAAAGIVFTLQLLQNAAELAIEAPLDGPRKQGAKTASRSLLIQDLKSYMQNNFHKKLYQVVATIVNTALNLKNDAVTQDMVRKA
jgi:hypothetical protein